VGLLNQALGCSTYSFTAIDLRPTPSTGGRDSSALGQTNSTICGNSVTGGPRLASGTHCRCPGREPQRHRQLLEITVLDHQRVSARLQELLTRLSGAAREAEGATVAERLADASDDEIFGFIDKELGA